MMALDRNDMDGALEIVRSYEMPETMHPQELLAWFTALREYWRAKGDRKQEKELSKSIRDIEKQFDLESGATFVRVPRRR